MKNLIAFIGVACALTVSSALATPKSTPCPNPAPSSTDAVFIVIVDHTAPRTPSLNAAIADSVLSAAKPGNRLVLWTFGGVNAGALPVLVHDIKVPKLEAPHNNLYHFANQLLLSDRQSAAIEICALSHIRTLQTEFYERVKAELAIADGSESIGASPILSAINSALAPFVTSAQTSVKVLVATDGREHSGLLSFYPKAGEKLSVDEMVARAGRVYPSRWTGVGFHFAGLGISDNGDLALLEEMRQVWAQIIRQRGGLIGELSPSSVQRLSDGK